MEMIIKIIISQVYEELNTVMQKLSTGVTSTPRGHVTMAGDMFGCHKLGFPGGSNGKESACNVGDPGLIPGSGRSSGEGNGNPSVH